MKNLKVILYYIFLVMLVVGWFVFMFWTLFLPKKYCRAFGTAFCIIYRKGCDLIFGFNPRVLGTENIVRKDVIYALKHQSTYETFWFGSIITNNSWVMKKSLMFVPILGWYFWRCGMVPINRKKGMDSIEKMISATKDIYKRGAVLSIFPEGTRRKLGAQPQYKKGAYILYSELNMPVIPVAVNTGLYWNRGIWKGKKGRVTMEFLPAIEKGLSKEEFMKRLQNDIETASNKLAKNP